VYFVNDNLLNHLCPEFVCLRIVFHKPNQVLSALFARFADVLHLWPLVTWKNATLEQLHNSDITLDLVPFSNESHNGILFNEVGVTVISREDDYHGLVHLNTVVLANSLHLDLGSNFPVVNHNLVNHLTLEFYSIWILFEEPHNILAFFARITTDFVDLHPVHVNESAGNDAWNGGAVFHLIIGNKHPSGSLFETLNVTCSDRYHDFHLLSNGPRVLVAQAHYFHACLEEAIRCLFGQPGHSSFEYMLISMYERIQVLFLACFADRRNCCWSGICGICRKSET